MGRTGEPGSGFFATRGIDTIGSTASHAASTIDSAGCMNVSGSVTGRPNRSASFPVELGMSEDLRMKYVQNPPAPEGTAARMEGSTALIRFVYIPPIDWPCANTA